MAKKVIEVRGAYAYDGDVVSRETGLVAQDDGVTQQQFAEECDINTIVRRFGLTGELPSGIAMPVSGDFTNVTDFHTAMNLIRQSQEAFLELPAHVRERFQNDPGRVMAFLENPENREEAVKLGMVAPPREVPRDVVKAVDELAAKIVPQS